VLNASIKAHLTLVSQVLGGWKSNWFSLYFRPIILSSLLQIGECKLLVKIFILKNFHHYKKNKNSKSLPIEVCTFVFKIQETSKLWTPKVGVHFKSPKMLVLQYPNVWIQVFLFSLVCSHLIYSLSCLHFGHEPKVRL